MKFTRTVEMEIEVDKIRLELPVRHEEEQIPYDFPFRQGNVWIAEIVLQTGQILGWKETMSAGVLHLKVVDEGRYYLMNGTEIVKELSDDYVPHGVVPGSYGDYVELKINEHGFITNWPIQLHFKEFYPPHSPT